MSLFFYFPSYRLNMFRAVICPSSGVCYYAVELPHWSFLSWFAVCWRFQLWFSLQPGHYSSRTTPKLQHTESQEKIDQCGNSTA